jgi:5-methylcytosine-specific restriction enzyme A
MPSGARRIDWTWEEIVLACDLVAQNEWRQLDEGDHHVRELSSLLQKMSIHPLDVRLPSFRNFAGVAQKTRKIASVHPDYVGRPSNGNKLDREVLLEFLADPQRMHSYAQMLRQAAANDELENVPQLIGDEEDSLEGRYLLRMHRVWERKPALRAKKIRTVQARGEPLCAKPVASTSERPTEIAGRASSNVITWNRCTRPESGPRLSINDLALLCSNCHRMIHRKPPWPTPAQLRDLIHH